MTLNPNCDSDYDYYYDEDDNEIKREILADFDASERGDYTVQVWSAYGFEDVKTFLTAEIAIAYALRKSLDKERQYRVLGPEQGGNRETE